MAKFRISKRYFRVGNDCGAACVFTAVFVVAKTLKKLDFPLPDFLWCFVAEVSLRGLAVDSALSTASDTKPAHLTSGEAVSHSPEKRLLSRPTSLPGIRSGVGDVGGKRTKQPTYLASFIKIIRSLNL